ncbi:hypothetical protein MRX96_016194 [Rhipicephalus microplus]
MTLTTSVLLAGFRAERSARGVFQGAIARERIRGCCDPGKVQPGGVQEGATEVPHLGGQAPTLSKKRRRALHLFLLREAQCVHGPRRSGRELGLIDPRLSSTDDCRRLLAGKTQHREA